MPETISLKDAVEARNSIDKEQRQAIANLYEKWADEVGKKAEYFKHKTTESSAVQEMQMRELEKMLRATATSVNKEIESTVKSGMTYSANAVVESNTKWLESLGFDSSKIDIAFNHVPDQVVSNILSGNLYKGGWSLSKSIWGDTNDTLKDLHEVIAGGLAENKSIYEISKDIEDYVRPSAAKNWNLTMKDGKKIYPKQVDYNAQRLARTLSQHAYQQSVVATSKKNPFILGIKWRATGSRACPICLARNGQIYSKNDLPLDHPNGMCTMEPVTDPNMDDRLINWVKGANDPEIDEFASNFGYDASRTAKAVKPKDSVKNKVVVQNLSDEAKDVVKRYTTGGYKPINEQADLYLSGTPREKAFSKSGSTLFDAVNSSTEKFDTLYRIETSSGFMVKDGKVVSSPLKEGDQITWGLRSTSKSDKFIGKAAAGKDKNLQFVGEDDFNTKVVYRLRDETGLDVSKISPYKSQQEVIVSGNFEVVTTGTVTDVGGERVILVDIKRKR